MREFRGRTAVVTGAASGIGRGLAEHCAGEGMNVVLADVEHASVEAVAAGLRESGTSALAVRCDVSKAEEVEALAQRSVEAFGGVHLVFNNAGVGGGAPTTWEATLDDWRWVLGVNLWGVIHGVRSFLPLLLKQEEETHVVNTASVCGLISVPGACTYNVSKHAVATLTETLHHELSVAHPSVGVSCLCPGHVSTRILESDRNRPAELGDVVEGEPDPMREAAQESFRAAITAGMPPSEVAEIAFDGIRNRRLWILTHPEWEPWVEKRAREIAQGEKPDVIGLARTLKLI